MISSQLIYFFLSIPIWFVGYLHTGRFVRPKWKIPGKFIFYVSVSFALIHWFGHWGLSFIVGHPLLGLIFHTKICHQHHINWLTCEPRDKYLKLQEKWATGDFNQSSKKKKNNP